MGASIRTLWTTGFVIASVFGLAVVGCSDDDDDGTGSAGGGSGGKAGSGGAAAGKGGSGGTSAGKGGGGSGGKAGSNNAGSGGEMDAAGAGGEVGVGGETGLGGAAGDSGVGGAGGDTGVGGEGGAPAALTCADYCDLVQTGCTAGADQQYPTEAQCLASCAAFPTAAGTNSLACRLGEAAQIATSVTHCDAAGPAGVLVCGTPCDAYCNLMTTYCSHEADGATLEDCMAECAGVPDNDITTFAYAGNSGDNLSCRIAHATNAAADSDPNGAGRLAHCNHAAGDLAPCLDATP